MNNSAGISMVTTCADCVLQISETITNAVKDFDVVSKRRSGGAYEGE